MPGDNNNNLTDAQRKEAAEAAAALATAPTKEAAPGLVMTSGDGLREKIAAKRNSSLSIENLIDTNGSSNILVSSTITSSSSNLENTAISGLDFKVRPAGVNTAFGLIANYNLSPKTLITENEIGPKTPEFSNSFFGLGASMNFFNNNLALQSHAGFGTAKNAVRLGDGSIYSAEKTSPAIQFGASTGPNLAKFVNLGFSYTTYLSGAAKVQPATQEIGVYNQPNYLEFYASAGYNEIDISKAKNNEDKIGVNAFVKLGSYLGGNLNVPDQNFDFDDIKPTLSFGVRFTSTGINPSKKGK